MHSFYKENDQSFWVQIMHLWDLEFGALFVAGSPRVYDGIKPFWWKVKNSICFSFVWWGSWHNSTGTRSGMIVQRKMICLQSTWNAGQAGRVPRCFALALLTPSMLRGVKWRVRPVCTIVSSHLSQATMDTHSSRMGTVSFPDHSPGSLDTKPICPHH